jgi:Mlc titration factor MtfA (ptsG expression regulator)
MLGWWRSRRRRRRKQVPFPAEWEQWLARWFVADRWLNDDERRKLRDWIKAFLPDKYWEGCGGLRMTDEIKVAISAHVGWLVLGLDDEYFQQVASILVYPDAYRAPGERRDNWIVSERSEVRLGQTEWHGPVLLSCRHVRKDGSNPVARDNLVLHEFAHQLDYQNGDIVDGTPRMQSRSQLERWIAAMTPAFEQLNRRCRQGRGHPALSCYGTKNVAEFFAVATESFFTQPVDLRDTLPDVYAALREYYRQDPAARIEFSRASADPPGGQSLPA